MTLSLSRAEMVRLQTVLIVQMMRWERRAKRELSASGNTRKSTCVVVEGLHDILDKVNRRLNAKRGGDAAA